MSGLARKCRVYVLVAACTAAALLCGQTGPSAKPEDCSRCAVPQSDAQTKYSGASDEGRRFSQSSSQPDGTVQIQNSNEPGQNQAPTNEPQKVGASGLADSLRRWLDRVHYSLLTIIVVILYVGVSLTIVLVLKRRRRQSEQVSAPRASSETADKSHAVDQYELLEFLSTLQTKATQVRQTVDKLTDTLLTFKRDLNPETPDREGPGLVPGPTPPDSGLVAPREEAGLAGVQQELARLSGRLWSVERTTTEILDAERKRQSARESEQLALEKARLELETKLRMIEGELAKSERLLRDREQQLLDKDRQIARLAMESAEMARLKSKLSSTEATLGDRERQIQEQRGQITRLTQESELAVKLKAKLSNAEAVLAEHERNMQEQSNEIAHLKTENEAAARVKAEAVTIRDDVTKLLNNCRLPDFLAKPGEDSPQFLSFLFEANKTAPDQAARMDLMLRLFEASSKKDDSAFELYLSVYELGKSLYALMQTSDHSSQYALASAWARALERNGNSRFSIFVPVVGTPFNTLDMIGGTTQNLIEAVKGWGVRNRSGHMERKAVVK